MKFLVLAVVDVTDSQMIVKFIEELKWQLGNNFQASFAKLEERDQLAPEFYMPCPRDGLLTRMETLGGQDREVYCGTCSNGHELKFVDSHMAENYTLEGRT